MFEISALWIQACWMQAFLKKYEIVPSGHNDGSRKRSLSRDCDAWATLHWRQSNAFYLMFRCEISWVILTYYAMYWRQPNTLFLMFIFETSWKILIINIVDNKPCLNYFDQCLVAMLWGVKVYVFRMMSSFWVSIQSTRACLENCTRPL